MMVKIGLYWQHDLDLVALYMHPDFEFTKWMKLMVLYLSDHNIINNKDFQEKYENLFGKATGEYHNVAQEGFHIPLPSSVPYHLNLSDSFAHFYLNPANKMEEKAIKYLLGFRYGSRSNGLKVLFRSFLDGVYMEPYFNEVMFSSLSRRKRNTTSKASKTTLSSKKTKQKKVIATGNNLNNTTHAEDDSLDKTSKTYPSESSSVSVKSVVPSDTSSVSIKEEKKDATEPFNKETIESIPENTISETLSKEADEELDDSGFDMFGAVSKLMGGGF